MAVTIKDVAREAQVSPSTVSRVISDDPSISDKTKIKVRKIMEDMKYYPNLNARKLVRQEANVVGLVLPNNSDQFYQNPFFPTVLRGISDLATKSSYTILLNSANDDHERLKHIKNLVFGKQVDGLIFLYSKENDELVEFLLENQFPFVVIGSPNDTRIFSVDNDNYQMSKCLTEQLLVHYDCRKIAFVGGDLSQHFMKRRYKGYQAALLEAGINLNEHLCFNNIEFLSKAGYQLVHQLAKITDLDGIVIADQLVAEGLKSGWRNLSQNKLPMVSFKAFEGLNLCLDEEIYIDIQAQSLGYTALEILLDIMNSQPTPESYQKVIEGKLVITQS